MTSNKLKIIAVIFMLIDHFAYYFYYTISTEVYTWCRILGRISMPIFVYLLVQGYFNTKSVKKYKIRLLLVAIVTQILILVMKHVNTNYYSLYVTNTHGYLNIVFSLFLSMGLICLIDRKILYANTFVISIFDKLIRLFLIFGIGFLYLKVPFDYKYFIPVLAITIYVIEKFREFFEWDFHNFSYKVVLGVVIGILLMMSSFILNTISSFSVFALIFILMYNGKLEKKSLFLKNMFYVIFPLQHIILYYLAMIMHS